VNLSFTTHVLALSVALICAAAALSQPHVPADTLPADFGAQIPRGLVPRDHADAPPRPEVLALGRALFFDPILSADHTVACASCHDPAHGFADTAPLSLGIRGQHAVRNSPSLFNRGFGKHFSWTGVAESLTAQVLLPIANPLEMGSSPADAIERLRADATSAARFEAAFGSGPSVENLGLALAAFVSRIHCGDSPVDRFQAGDFAALDDKERAGLWIYESKGGCWRCHSGPNYSDEDFHATGIGAHEGKALAGRFDISADEHDRGRFKTPTLRGLAFTAPYMHDGSLATLEDVVAYYSRGGNTCAELDERIRPLTLAPDESAALLAFLRALSRTTE
jgi:cytochrome c peroxidase